MLVIICLEFTRLPWSFFILSLKSYFLYVTAHSSPISVRSSEDTCAGVAASPLWQVSFVIRVINLVNIAGEPYGAINVVRNGTHSEMLSLNLRIVTGYQSRP